MTRRKLPSFTRWLIFGVVIVLLIFVVGGAIVHYGLITTTAIVVRHAEKAPDGDDPPLNLEGRMRAEELKHVVESANVAAAYCCRQHKRTRETVDPLGVPITEIDHSQVIALVNDVLANHAGQTVVIAGHSDTVPNIVRELGGRLVQSISESEYDNLYIVIVHEVSALRLLGLHFRKVDTLLLKYGPST